MIRKVYAYLCSLFLVLGRKLEPIEIINATQKFEIINSYICGHPVKATISFCTCDCRGDIARQNHYYNPKYRDRCTKNQLCFEVFQTHLVGKHCRVGNRVYGICSLQILPTNIYKHMRLDHPKIFINIKMNENGQDINISLPINYKTLVYKGIGYKINCVKDSDELLSNKKGWYFIREGESQVITKTKYPQKYNEQKEVDFEKLCWYQLENRDEIMKELNNLNPLTNEVCEQSFYLPKLESIKGLYQEDSATNEDFLHGNNINVDFIKLSENTIELYYSCNNEFVESDEEFVQLFLSVHLQGEDIYLTRNDNYKRTESDVYVVVLDERGREITEEKTVRFERITVLQLQKEFHNFSERAVLVCINTKISLSNNCCERFHLMKLDSASVTITPQTRTVTTVIKMQSSLSEVTNNSSGDGNVEYSTSSSEDGNVEYSTNSNQYIHVAHSDYITILAIVLPLIFAAIVIILFICCYYKCKNRSKPKEYANVPTCELEENILMVSRETDRSTISSRIADTKDSEDTRTSDNGIEKAYKEKLINLPHTTVINFIAPIRHVQVGDGNTAVNTEHVDKVPITTTVHSKRRTSRDVF